MREFHFSNICTVIGLILAYMWAGLDGFIIAGLLILMEVSLSFDNAVVNATILKKMSTVWRKRFMTWGILIAVFGMRLVFPIVLVSLATGLNMYDVTMLAFEDKEEYSRHVLASNVEISMFGGMFLLMLFLDWIFEDKEHAWLSWLERPLAKLGKLDVLAVVMALIALVLTAELLAEDPADVMVSGVLGIITYLVVNGLGQLFESQGLEEAEADATQVGVVPGQGGASALVKASGKAAFFLFLYLEVLDASFSFDGVIGAFAITQDIFIIATVLGVGAMYIRSTTVYLVRKGTLQEFVYLEHGAHWAIGALAVILLVTIQYHVPELVTGLIGVAFIGAAFASSIRLRKVLAAHKDDDEVDEPDTVGAAT
ncbi:MAG TPA: DUF475 domain-containing protein [Zoogloea sp.]|nr:DUF475 domain-containing protein [Zoogloea sp.]